MMRFLRLCLLLVLPAVSALRADTTQNAGDWDSVTVEPVKTSIYVGSVTLTPSEFRRRGDEYAATYEARVWPWFWWNETGQISIRIPTSDLERLSRGERIEFTGDASNHKHKPRRVSGRAERANGASGKIKVRISVDNTELIFNSTYRFNNALK